MSSDRTKGFRKILVVRTDRLGDVILTLPLVAFLRSQFPDAHIAMLLRKYTADLVEGNPYVTELIHYDKDGELLPFGELRKILRERSFDLAIVAYPRLRIALLLFLASIPIRVGSGYRYYSILFNKKVFEHRKDAKKHELEYNLGLLKILDLTGKFDKAQVKFGIEIPEIARENVDRILRDRGLSREEGYVIIHPGSGGSAREWPFENFGMLGKRLADKFDKNIIITGGTGEDEKVLRLAEMIGERATPIVGLLSMKELAALIQGGTLFISHSTGPLHIAAALGTPVVGLFSQVTAMNANRWGPYTEKAKVIAPSGKPVDCNDCAKSKTATCACMSSITVEEVFKAASGFLTS